MTVTGSRPYMHVQKLITAGNRRNPYNEKTARIAVSAVTTATTSTRSPPQATATTLTAAVATVPAFHLVSDTAVDTGSYSDDQEEFEKLHLEIRKEEIRKFWTSGSVLKISMIGLRYLLPIQ